MSVDREPRDLLLDRVLAYAVAEGIADKSLREIATGVGTSHRMLIYHFGSREGLLTAVVGAVEAGQRGVLAGLTDTVLTDTVLTGTAGPDGTRGGAEVMLRLWDQLSDPALRPFVRLFFTVVGLAVQGVPGTGSFLDTLTGPWLDEAGAAARQLGVPVDRAALRLGVAASRGLLLELLAGADPAEVDASFRLLAEMWQQWANRAAGPSAI